MPRPRKCRKVCRMPAHNEFRPYNSMTDKIIVLTVDEYETIRLIDMEGFSQEECAAYMQVGRTTAQRIYNSASKKLATVLVSGAALRIEGGDYRLCDGNEDVCGCGGCHRHKRKCEDNKE